MLEWTRTDAAGGSYASRVSHLRGENPGGNNAAILLTETTVHHDQSEDVLTGSAGSDWFFLNRDGDGLLRDRAVDMSTFESLFAEDSDWI